MKIIEPHRIKSKRVESWGQIKDDAEAIRKMLNEPNFTGKWKAAYAIHHSQVSGNEKILPADPLSQVTEPYNFFVLNDVQAKIVEADVIINPEILQIEHHSEQYTREGCMSYPFRNTVRVKRFNKIKVGFQVKSWRGLVSKERVLGGVTGQIFQHETDHARAKYIYDGTRRGNSGGSGAEN